MSDMTNEELADWLDMFDDCMCAAIETPELREAAARLRQQSEDSARLDWFQACGWVWRMVPAYQGGDGAYELEWVDADGYSHTVRADLLREAMDKARRND